jgi:superfamily II DNA or RNA helicase/HKD family nuclease
MARIIDNSREKLAEVLNRELAEVAEVAIATAYFNVMGFGDVENGLDGKPLRLLLGRPPEETIKWEDEILHELEEYEDDPQYFRLLQRAIAYFEDPSRQVRIVEGRFFHGKAFMGANPSLSEVRNGFAVVGSSNFTHGGLTTNLELNMLNTDREAVQELADWFQRQWNDSRDYKEEFLSMLKAFTTSWSPYEVAAKALWETYKHELEKRAENILKHLYPHQQLSTIDALNKLEKHNGVLIADSTGLGKTRIALSIVQFYRMSGVKCLLIAPKSILDTTWKNEMYNTDINVEYLNSEKLSADPDVVEGYINRDPKPGLVVVDEAHYFRNRSTNRYDALSKLVESTSAKLVLMTATPVNTSLMDLYHLLSLYLPEHAIFDEYRMNLRDYFVQQHKRWLNGEPIDMDDVLRRFVVRHSRMLAKALSKGAIRFPERRLHTVQYDLPADVGELYDVLDGLNLAFYDLSVDRLPNQFKLPDGTPVSKYVEFAENLKNIVKGIRKIGLLKRLESSVHAFRESVRRMKEYIEIANKYAGKNNVFIPPRLKGQILSLIDDDEPEKLPSVEEVFAKQPELRDKCSLTDEEAREFIRRNNEDLEKLDKALSMLPNEDPKIQEFVKAVSGVYRALKGRNGVIIFTQYVDTAWYIFENLKKKGLNNLLLVTGEGAEDAAGKHLEEAEAVEHFQKQGGIMVSTDVLSAGQNLQNAQYVVNYDFPWNPVILIQRAGRIDRIGSDYDVIYLYNVLPRQGDPEDPRTLEHFLNLMTRIYRRLEAIRETIGLDASTLDEEAIPKDFSEQRRIAAEDAMVLAEIEKRLEQFTRDPRDDLAEIINEKGIDWVKNLPDGIGAIKRGGMNAVFALFTDGEKHYWRLKNLDSGKVIDNPSEIIKLLLSGDDVQTKGVRIDYESLVDVLRALKVELLNEIREKERVRITRERVPTSPNKVVKEIYDTLEKMGEIELAARFREASSNSRTVTLLKKALEKGRLVEEARKLLSQIGDTKPMDRKPIKLKRLCWCVITP